MSPERDNLNENERELLGAQSADELVRDQRWLAGRLESADLPEGLEARVSGAIAGELARERRGAWARRLAVAGLAAAMLLLAATVWMVVHQPATPTDQPIATEPPKSVVVARRDDVDRLVNDYVQTIDQDVVAMSDELAVLQDEMSGGDAPWRDLLDVK